jgi:hypothetical protein
MARASREAGAPPEQKEDKEERVPGASGAYSTGAAKYRKNRGKARIWSVTSFADVCTFCSKHTTTVI